MSDAQNMPEDFLPEHLATIARMLALIPMQQLDEYVNKHHLQLGYYDAVGPILQPTEYRDVLQNGRYDDARHQLKIVDALLTVRKLIEEREGFVREIAEKKGRS